ncbi:MAG: DUF2141 domain-containing protein [Saprospiraceae bacterium]|nr:DUF2141 domain-containing protein [Lewinella sp.]
MNTIYTILIGFVLVLLDTYTPQSLAVSRLTVEIEPIEYETGMIHMAIYDREDTFPDAPKPYRKQKIPVRPGGRMEIEIEELPPGRYAIAVYLDENGNDELDKNVFGIPKEAYGFSNNPRAKWSAPTFQDVAFEMNTENRRLSIDLKKWKHR